MARRELPEINASSMADIAFLLLTFFLIATTLNREEGIQRLVPDPTKPPPDIVVNEQNLMRILVNQMGQIQINGENREMKDIQVMVKEFVDNGGGKGKSTDKPCEYCKGAHDPTSSTTPQDAIVSLELDKATPYNYFFTVENYIDKAYLELLDRYSNERFGISYRDLEARANDVDKGTQEDRDKLEEVEAAYPKQIAKAKLKTAN